LADYRVNLDIFAGPLDLLLYLVRKDEVDIYDIPIAAITEQYIEYIEMLKNLDIDLAGDFLVMAATLMQIKSAMLLPTADQDAGEGDDLEDPRAELIRQLLEYKKFKDAANLLDEAADEHRQRFPRSGSIVERLKPDAEPGIDMDQVSVWDLLEAFDSLMKATGSSITDLSHIKDDTPIDLYQVEILHRLQAEGPMNFERLFESKNNRVVLIGLFLALLELIRERLVWAEQAGSSNSIYLRSLTEEPAEQAVQQAIIAVASETQNNHERSDVERQKEPPISIRELPPKAESSSSAGADQSQTVTRITELPPKKDRASDSSRENEAQSEPATESKE